MTKPNTALAIYAQALETALKTLEAVQATVEASCDQQTALELKDLINNVGDAHLCALITSTGGTVHEIAPEFLAVNARVGVA